MERRRTPAAWSVALLWLALIVGAVKGATEGAPSGRGLLQQSQDQQQQQQQQQCVVEVTYSTTRSHARASAPEFVGTWSVAQLPPQVSALRNGWSATAPRDHKAHTSCMHAMAACHAG